VRASSEVGWLPVLRWRMRVARSAGWLAEAEPVTFISRGTIIVTLDSTPMHAILRYIFSSRLLPGD
jgi:hypothetical protein